MRRTTDRVFGDSNIFLYEIDKRDSVRQEMAISLVADPSKEIVVSYQVLHEAYVNAIRKVGLSPTVASSFVESITEQRIVDSTLGMTKAAIALSQHGQMSFRDALIIEAVVAGRCDTLITEDLNHGQIIRGVRIESVSITGGTL